MDKRNKNMKEKYTVSYLRYIYGHFICFIAYFIATAVKKKPYIPKTRDIYIGKSRKPWE